VFALGNRRVCIRKGRVCALGKSVFASETLYIYMEKEDVFALGKGVFALKKGASAITPSK